MADLFGKTKIEGTIYDITGGTTLINGVAHPITIGKTLKDGTVYEINKKYTLKDLLNGSITYKGKCNYSSSLYQLYYTGFDSSYAGQTWYCFNTHGGRLQITKVVIESNGVNLTRLQAWATSASMPTQLTADGFQITDGYTYGGLMIFLRFNSYSTDIVDDVLSNCSGEVIKGYDTSTTNESAISFTPSQITPKGLLFCSFSVNNSYWCFNEASAPLTTIRTYANSSFVTDYTILRYNNTDYALSTDGSSATTYRIYGYTIARIY